MLKNGKLVSSFEDRSRLEERIQRQDSSFQTKPLKNWFFKISLFLLILTSSLFIWQKSNTFFLFPIKHIKIIGDLSLVSRDHLQQIITPFSDKGFLHLEVAKLQERLLQEPWIKTVTIKRFWPDTLWVKFIAKQPIAWSGKKLLDSEGDSFSVENINKELLQLPVFICPSDQQKTILQTYQKIQPLFLKLGLKIKLLKYIGTQFWYLRLNNGLGIYFNQNDNETQLMRFLKIYPIVIADKVTKLNYIDLRYAHGMALKFKDVRCI